MNTYIVVVQDISEHMITSIIPEIINASGRVKFSKTNISYHYDHLLNIYIREENILKFYLDENGTIAVRVKGGGS